MNLFDSQTGQILKDRSVVVAVATASLTAALPIKSVAPAGAEVINAAGNENTAA